MASTGEINEGERKRMKQVVESKLERWGRRIRAE
jgi:hypothetical protein